MLKLFRDTNYKLGQQSACIILKHHHYVDQR